MLSLCAFSPHCLISPFQLNLERYPLWLKGLLANSFACNFTQDVIRIHGSHMHRSFECFFSMGTVLTVTSVVQLAPFKSVELNGVSLAGVLLALSVLQITVTITYNICWR